MIEIKKDTPTASQSPTLKKLMNKIRESRLNSNKQYNNKAVKVLFIDTSANITADQINQINLLAEKFNLEDLVV